MKPYYEDLSVQIWLGDCRAIIPTLPKVDLVLTDPPYGINAARHRNSQVNGWRDYGTVDEGKWDAERAPQGLIDMMVSIAPKAVIWGGNYWTLPPRMGWLVWDKGQRDFSLADVELAWTSENRAARIFDMARSAAMHESERVHPTQKPVALMRWCLEFFPDANLILDPFMGSGTTLRAAKDLGRKAIGIEIEERYCEIAAKRMSQLAMQLS